MPSPFPDKRQTTECQCEAPARVGAKRVSVYRLTSETQGYTARYRTPLPPLHLSGYPRQKAGRLPSNLQAHLYWNISYQMPPGPIQHPGGLGCHTRYGQDAGLSGHHLPEKALGTPRPYLQAKELLLYEYIRLYIYSYQNATHCVAKWHALGIAPTAKSMTYI